MLLKEGMLASNSFFYLGKVFQIFEEIRRIAVSIPYSKHPSREPKLPYGFSFVYEVKI
jgi:hypothetical protein